MWVLLSLSLLSHVLDVIGCSCADGFLVYAIEEGRTCAMLFFHHSNTNNARVDELVYSLLSSIID